VVADRFARYEENNLIEGECGAVAVGVGDTDVSGLALQMSSGSSMGARRQRRAHWRQRQV